MDTANGSPIDNSQVEELSPFESAQLADAGKSHPNARVRSQSHPRYNCHGLTFGSRRTAVTETDEIHKIIDHDGYREVKIGDAQPGDTILYFGETGDIQHSGIVVSAPAELYLGIPYVVSKWGKGGEFLHAANDCPYPYNVKCYRIAK